MCKIVFIASRRSAFTLVETMVASAAGLLLVAVLASAAFAEIGRAHV